MKRVLAIVLVMIMALGMIGCTAKDNNKEQEIDTSTPCGIVLADFKEKSSLGSALDIADQLSVAEYLPFMGAAMEVEEGYLNGFTTEITGFKSGAMFAPMIGAIPFIGYVFEVEGDSAAFIETLKASADLRWNVCTSADEMQALAAGKYVCFVMAPASFEEE